MSTAGNVVFAGSYEGYFYALDAESSKELWHIYLGGAGGGATMSTAPISYLSNGSTS